MTFCTNLAFVFLNKMGPCFYILQQEAARSRIIDQKIISGSIRLISKCYSLSMCYSPPEYTVPGTRTTQFG